MTHDGVIRKCCPVCGGRIEVSYLYQYSLDYRLNKDGRLSKRYTKRDGGSMECGLAACLNCHETWEDNEFDIDSDDRFVDYKERNDG